MNLRTKLWLLIIVSTLTGLCLFVGTAWIIGGLFNQGYTHVRLNEIGTRLAAEAEQLNDSSDRVEALFDQFVRQHPEMQLEWFSQDGTLLYASDGRTRSYDFDELMNRFLDMPSSLWQSGRHINLVFDWQQDAKRQYLIMTLPSEAMQSKQIFFYVRDHTEFIQLLIPLALFLAALYGFALFFFSRMNRRLRNLNQAMNAVDAQSDVIALEDASKDEIGHLTRHFNRMSERIRQQFLQIRELEAKRKTLISNLSHDLRTPITMIQGYAETLHAGMILDEEEKKKYMEIILRRSRYMDQLLQKLLEIAQLDTYKERINLKRTNVSELLRRIAADYVPVSENREITFDVRIPEQSIESRMDPHLVERAVRNLLDNAIQYGGSGGYLLLALDEKDKELEIHVRDHGPGVPEEQQKLIFERFYRGSKGREGEGLGIGLSIVHEIAVAHEGSIHMKSIRHDKTTFTLVLPKKK